MYYCFYSVFIPIMAYIFRILVTPIVPLLIRRSANTLAANDVIHWAKNGIEDKKPF